MKKRKKNAAAVALGRRGGLKGGYARAAGMTAEERTESARNAVNARWAKRTMILIIKSGSSAGKPVITRKTKPPKLSWTNGRAWGEQKKTINGRNVEFHYEVGRGTRMYFKWDGRWYVTNMFQDNDPFDFHHYTIADKAEH